MQPEQPLKQPLLAAFRARYLLHPALFLATGFGLLAIVSGAGYYGIKNLASGPAPGSGPQSGLNNNDSKQDFINTEPGSKPGGTAANNPSGSSQSKNSSQSQSKTNKSSGSSSSQTNNTGNTSGGSNPPPPPPPPPAPTYDSETAYSAPAFTASRVVDVFTQSAFNTAWSNIQPGDQIKVHGVTFTGEVALNNKTMASDAEIDFDAATKFVGGSNNALPDVWISNTNHLRLFGGDISGQGVLIYGSSYVLWYGFKVHDVAGQGVFITGVNRAVDHADIKGEVSNWGTDLTQDPHAEKGTGLHGINVADSSYGVNNSRIAMYTHDGSAGAGMQIGGANATDNAADNTIYMKCLNLTMHAVSQIAGNCVQVWGENITNNDFKYIEATNLQGRPFDVDGVYSGQTLSTNTIDYGRATNTNLNSSMNESIAQNVHWDSRGGVVLVDVAPTP